MEEIIIDEGIPEQNERVDFFLNFGLDAPEINPEPNDSTSSLDASVQ